MTQLDLSAVRYWVVSAWWPEQRELAHRLGFVDPSFDDNEPISVCGAVAFLRTGVGTPRAVAALSKALMLGQMQGSTVEAVLFVATAGTYSSTFALGRAYLVSKAHWTDGDLLLGRSYLPRLQKGYESLNSCLQPFSDEKISAISTPGISLDEELSRKLCEVGTLENLELYGVAMAAQDFGIPWGAVLGVSNMVGPGAHSEWKENHIEASRSAQNLLFECFLRSVL